MNVLRYCLLKFPVNCINPNTLSDIYFVFGESGETKTADIKGYYRSELIKCFMVFSFRALIFAILCWCILLAVDFCMVSFNQISSIGLHLMQNTCPKWHAERLNSKLWLQGKLLEYTAISTVSLNYFLRTMTQTNITLSIFFCWDLVFWKGTGIIA